VGRETVKIVVRDDDGGESTQIEDIEVANGGPVGDDDDDCSCSLDRRGAPLGWAGLLLLVATLLVRRRV